ncbi:MAG TPA: thiamine pyrophosphate-dependent enzyme [Dehalococcoidia bacterium]|nr:thiamine pyrophosphate-dependent enzyme [Dehalococcoidia bacterium]
MPEMTGGEALVQSLKTEGVQTIFGLPGVQLDWAFDALWRARDEIRVLNTRHEQATAYMADGFARTTGKVGTALVVPGPGLLNASGALSTAYACNSPVLMVSGQVQSDLIESGRGLLHEIPNQLGMVRSVTKWAGRAMTPQEVPGLVHHAFHELQSGRRRPVEIEVPPDVLQKKADVTLLEPYQPDREQPDPDLIEQAARALGQAERPLIFSGGGILGSGAWEELQRLAELLGAPVIMTENGRGALSDRHPLGMTPLVSPVLTPKADVILAVGTRFLQPLTMPWGPKPGQTVIRLDIDPEEITRVAKPDIAIVADAKAGLAQLGERVQSHNRARASRGAEFAALKAEAREQLNSIQPQADYALAIREEVPEDGIFVSEMTQVGYWSRQGFPVYQPRTFVGAGYQGTLGFGFGTALGVAVGNPEKKVVSINGDGGFGYQLSELATLMKHGITNLVTIVFNDNAYGNVRRIQRQQFNEQILGSDLLNPDYVKLAEAFGMAGARATSPAELRHQLHAALADGQPTLIEVPLGEVPSIWGLALKRA